MKRSLWALGVVLVSGGLRAGEWTVQWVPQARVEYEGTGFRETPNGWELKVKPWTPAGGLRWRQSLSPRLTAQVQYWANRPAYFYEIGNSSTPVLNQIGQTRQSVQALWVDLRRPLAGSGVEAVGGVHGVYQSFRRKNIVFNSVPEPESTLDTQTGLGVHMGVALGSPRGLSTDRRWFWEGEFLLGRLLWTKNNRRVEGGSIRWGGYTYSFRWEVGRTWGRTRWGVGYTRQLYEIFVPGGRSLSGGAAGSLPINKTDFFGPYFSLGWVW